MKADVGSPKDGDVSPIIQSVSNLADESKASTSKPKKTEPVSELRPNFSRVTPAQLSYISFAADGRYQPVRAVSTKTPLSKSGKAVAVAAASLMGLGSQKYAGGGGILILTDSQSSEEAEYIEIETAIPVVPPPAAQAAPAASVPASAPPSGRHIALDEGAPESEPPEAFEVSSFPIRESYATLTFHSFLSTHSIMIPRVYTQSVG